MNNIVLKENDVITVVIGITVKKLKVVQLELETALCIEDDLPVTSEDTSEYTFNNDIIRLILIEKSTFNGYTLYVLPRVIKFPLNNAAAEELKKIPVDKNTLIAVHADNVLTMLHDGTDSDSPQNGRRCYRYVDDLFYLSDVVDSAFGTYYVFREPKIKSVAVNDPSLIHKLNLGDCRFSYEINGIRVFQNAITIWEYVKEDTVRSSTKIMSLSVYVEKENVSVNKVQ